MPLLSPLRLVQEQQNVGYRTPDVLRPMERLDLLELSGTTSAATRVLGLSHPTVSRH